MDGTELHGSNIQRKDGAVCESCKTLFVKNEQIINNLRKDLAKQEVKVCKLEEEAVKQTENLENVLEEKAFLENSVNSLKVQLGNLQSAQVHENKSSKGERMTQTLDVLQEQLRGLEDEKKRLNEAICRFENDTEELSDMFSMQREKFELEFGNKERVISVLEKERELMEKDSKYNRDELEKMRCTNENMKKVTEQLKSSIQEKDAAIVNLSDLHNAALKQTNELQRELISSEESLNNELSSKEITEGQLRNERKVKALLNEETEILKIQLKKLNENDAKFRAAENQMRKEIEQLNELVETMGMEKTKNEKDFGELEKMSAMLRHEKENTEDVLEEVERKAGELKIDFESLRDENFKMEKERCSLETLLTNLESEITCLSEAKGKQEKEVFNHRKCLEEVEQSLETITTENTGLEENVQALEKVLDELKNNGERQRKCIETTKEELDAVNCFKESMEVDNERLKDNNRLLKEKVETLSKEIESLQASCITNTNQNERLEDILNKKTRTIASLQEQEQKLEHDIDELLGNEASSGVELKNARNECTRLKQGNKSIEKNYEKVNVQLQECLGLLQVKREEYLTEKKRLKEELERHSEETSRFREQNGEMSEDLRNRNDDIISLTMENEELLRSFDEFKIKLEASACVEDRLEEEVYLVKQRLEEKEKDTRQAVEEKDEVKRKYEDLTQKLNTKQEEKKDIEISLAISLEEVGRLKKGNREIKEERDRLQMQIEELDRDVNEKHIHFTEEKSGLEKDMKSLRHVVRRLKSNEGKLRSKIEDLRDEVDKLSDVKSEQQAYIRTIVHEKNRMQDTIADYEKIMEENVLLQKDNEEARRENIDLRKNVDALQEKTRTLEEENERRKKELQESQNRFDDTKEQVKESSQQCKELRNENGALRDCNAEIQEEKQRLFNENSRLKEKKNSMVQERNKLQDMIESLDKCHSDRYENLTRKIALFEKEVISHRQTIKNCEEREKSLLKEKKESNEKLQAVMNENEYIQKAHSKGDLENTRLRKRVEELMKEVEQKELESEVKMCMEINLQEKEECIRKLKQNAKVLNTLIISLNHQQNQRKDELQQKDKEIEEMIANIEKERTDKTRFKDVIRRLDEELRAVQTRERQYIEELRDEKDKNGQHASLILSLEKERDDSKELFAKNSAKHVKKIEDEREEKHKLLETIQKLEEANIQGKLCNDNLNSQIQTGQEDVRMLTAEKVEVEGKLMKIDEEKVELTNEINMLQKENRSLREHGENLEKIFASKNSAMSDQTSGMEKEIKVLRRTLAQLRDTEAMNRQEIDEIKGKLEKERKQKIDNDVKFNEMRLKQERLEGKNEELLSNYARHEEMANKGVELKLEMERMQQTLAAGKQRQEALEQELEGKTQELADQNIKLENLKRELSNYNESLQKLKNTKEELFASNEELLQKNEQILQEFESVNEKYEQLSSEKQRLSELVTSQEEDMKSLKEEVYSTKGKLQLIIQEVESETSQLQDDLNTKEEAVERMTEKQQKLQEDLRKVKKETEDLENENEDLLAELDQSKEEFKKLKDTLCALQMEYSNLHDELREKLNGWNEKADKVSLEKFGMDSEIISLKERLTQAHDRTEKQRELEKILREEIEELSDAYVKLEEEIHHCNKENQALKEKVQELLQNVEELEVANETASLLKEKRQSELLKSESNVQQLEQNIRERQKANKKLSRELDEMIEQQKFQEIQLVSEKDLSGQRLKELQELQNSQRKLQEQLWLTKRNQEKLEVEIETWLLNSNSMKLRIEMLEDELKNTSTENEMTAQLCMEIKNEKCFFEEEAQRKELELTKQRDSLEEHVGEISEEKDRLDEETSRLVGKLNKQKNKITGLNTSLEDAIGKYECSRMLVSVLHNDIKTKDEQIEKLERRKRQMVNLLSDLDVKIAEIQVQAISLESENDRLREDLSRSRSTGQRWKETAEQQAKLFAEKLERETTEKQQLHNTKEFLKQAHLSAEVRLQEASIAMIKLHTKQGEIIAENVSLLESKNTLREIDLTVDKLSQALNIERNKTVKLNEEMFVLLNELQALKNKNIRICEKHEKTESELENIKTKIKDTEGRLEDKSSDLDKTKEDLRAARLKVSEQEENLAVMTVKHNEMFDQKNDVIERVKCQNDHFEKMVDSLTSDLRQCQAENTRNEIEKKHVEEIVTCKQQLLDDLRESHQNMVNTKEALESEKKCLSSKLKQISKILAKLECVHENCLSENRKLHAEIVYQQRESSEQRNELLKEKKMLEEELQVQKTTSENHNNENNLLRERNEVESTQLEETVNCLKDIQQKLNNQKQENERLKKALRKSNLERNNLDEVNQKVSNALFQLKNETVYNNLKTQEISRKIHQRSKEAPTDTKKVKDEKVEFHERHGEEDLLGSGLVQLQNVDPQQVVLPRESSELETRVSMIQSEVRSLRNINSERDMEVCRLKALLDSSQDEKENLDVELARYARRYENECQKKEDISEGFIKIKNDLENSNKEKEDIIRNLQTKNLDIVKRSATMEVEIDFLKTSNLKMENHRQEMEEKGRNLQDELLVKEEELCCTKETIVSYKEEMTGLEKKNSELENRNEIIKELFGKYEREREKHLNEIKNLEELWIENVNQLEKLENRFHILKKQKVDDSFNAQDTFKKDEKDYAVNQEKEILASLVRRFDKINEKIAFQFKKIQILQDQQKDGQNQWIVCLEKLHECQNAKRVLEEECFDLQKMFTAVESMNEEARGRIDELETSLRTAKEKLAESNTIHEEESERILQELNQMQTELVSACDKFNSSFSNAKSLEERLEGNDKFIIVLENNLKCSREEEGMLKVRNAGLETKNEILTLANGELDKVKEELQKRNKNLENILRNEREASDKEGVQQQATIGQFKLKLEDAEWRGLKMKEQLVKAEDNLDQIQEELKTVTWQLKEKNARKSADVQESKNTILQLNRDLSQLKEDVCQLEKNRNEVSTTNKGLKEKISNVEEELQKCKSILNEANQEKEVLQRSLDEMFLMVFNDNEANCPDLVDQISKLIKVANVVEESRKREEMLTNDCKDLQKQLSIIQEDKKMLHYSFKTKEKEFKQLGDSNTKLKTYVKKLEMELDNVEAKTYHIEDKLRELKEDMETMKSKESQQQYQYKVLENEKESLENETVSMQDKVETLFKKIQHSIYLLNEFGADAKGRLQDDSGVMVDESELNITCERGPLDSGIFSPSYEKSIKFPDGKREKMFAAENNGFLQETVEKSVQIMTALDKTFHERTQLFSEKEGSLVNEVNVLKQAANHNNDIRRVLENNVQRLDENQKTLQEELKKKNDDITSHHAELRQLKTVLSEKENVVEMLNESVDGYQKRQELLENKLEVIQKTRGEEKNERLHLEKENMEYQKTCEELRQNSVRNDMINQKKTTELDTKIRELENQVTETENMNSQFRTVCAILRESSEHLNSQQRVTALRITELECHLQEAEQENKEAKARIADLSKELESSITTKCQLENNCKQLEEAYKEGIKQQTKANIERANDAKEIRKRKEESARLLLENSSLGEGIIVVKQCLKEKELENGLLVAEMVKKEQLVENNEVKLKVIGDYLAKINKCKDQLEKEINQAEKANEEMKNVNELLRKEKSSMTEAIKRKTLEIGTKEEVINQLEKISAEIEKALRENRHAMTRANDEVNKSLSQSEKIRNLIDATDNLLNYSLSTNLPDGTFSRPKSRIPDKERKVDDPRSVSQELAEVYITMETVFENCQRNMEDQQELLTQVFERGELLKNTEQENSELQGQKEHLQHKVMILSEKCSNLESKSEIQQQDFTVVGEKLILEKKTVMEHKNVNTALIEQVKQLQEDIASNKKLAEDLRKDRSFLKTELLEAQNEIACLKNTCEQIGYLKEELNNATLAMSELKAVHSKCLMEKDDARLEVEYARKKVKDLESVYFEEKRVLDETQKVLALERESVTTVTKAARLKENDLVKAKTALNSNQEFVQQLQTQMTEINEEKGALKKELCDIQKEMITVRQNNEELANEKVFLWEKNSTLKQQQEESDREKHAFKEENAKQNTEISLLIECREQQREENEKLRKKLESLRQECDTSSIKIQKLKSEKTKIMKAMESMEERLQARYQELLEKCTATHNKIRDLKTLYGKTRDMLIKSENDKHQLEKSLLERDEQLAKAQNQCMELQENYETQGESVEDLNNELAQLIDEINSLKTFETLSKIENSEQRSNLEDVKEHLEEMNTNRAQKEREKQIAQEKVSSGKAMVKTLRGAVAKSEKELEKMRDSVVEKNRILEKVYQDLEFQKRTTTQVRDDKSNLEELYQLCQRSEKVLRKDLEDCKMVGKKVKNESHCLRKANDDLKEKITEQKFAIKDFQVRLHAVTQEKMEIKESLAETRDALAKVNDDVIDCRKSIGDIRKKVYLTKMELTLETDSITDTEVSDGISTLTASSTGVRTDDITSAVGTEFRDTNESLDEIRSKLKSLVEVRRKMKRDIVERISENQLLSEGKSRHEGTINDLESSIDELKTKCKELKDEQTTQEKSYNKLKDERDYLDNNVIELQKSIFHEQEKNKLFCKEISTLTQDNCSLSEKIRVVEDSFRDVVKENTVLTLKQENQVQNAEKLLQESGSQLEYHKKLNEDTANVKKATEEKLHEVGKMLENSKNLLSQEKKLGENLKNENENLKLTLEANETEIKEKTDNLLSQLSAVKTSKETVQQELKLTETLVDDLKGELNMQRQKRLEIEKKRSSTAEELGSLKVDYSCVKTQLEQRVKENLKLQEERKTLKEQLNEMDEKIQRVIQEGLNNIGVQKQKIENFQIQLAASETANQILEEDFQEVKEKCDILRKEKYENQQQFSIVLEGKERNIKELESSCRKKEEAVVAEKHASGKLQRDVFSLNENLEAAESKLETLQKKHKDIAREMAHLHGIVVETWKLNETRQSSEKILKDGCEPDPSKIIRSLSMSLESLRDYTDELESNSSKLREQLVNSKEGNQKASIVQIQLNKEIMCLREKVQNLQNDSKSLKESLVESHRDFQIKNDQNETMQEEMSKLRRKETDSEKTIEKMEEENIVLNTEMGVIERKRATLEDVLRNLESERYNTTKEISITKDKIAVLQDKNTELSKRNSYLLEEVTSLENRAKTAETSLFDFIKETKELQQRLTKAQNDISILKKLKEDLEDEKESAQKKHNNLEKEKTILEGELENVKRMQEQSTEELSKLTIFNTETMKECTELEKKRTHLKEEKEKLERDVALFQHRIERIENEQSDKNTAKTRVQSQLNEAFNSLERQQSKLFQALSDKETLRSELLKAENELKVVMEDNADLNQQIYKTQKNIFASPNPDEFSRFRNRLSELRRKELTLTQENRFLFEKLREKSDELRESKLREEESKSEIEKSREKMRRYLDDRDQWEGKVKSVISQIGTHAQDRPSSDSENKKNFFPEKVNNTRRKIF